MSGLLKKIRTGLKDAGGQRGQVVTEYAIMMAMFTVVALALLVLLFYFSEYGWRAINLVSIDYP